MSISILGITVTGVSALFNNGLSSLQRGEDVMLFESALRSQMETLVSRPFAEVLLEGSGSSSFLIRGDSYTVRWTAQNHDLNGDSIPEADAMLLRVMLEGRSIWLIQVDHDGQLGIVP